MFIKKLYHFNKLSAFIVIIFLMAFLYINYKWGTVATPILQFGMYSSVFHIGDTQQVYIVKVNNEVINQAKMSQVDIDIIQVYLSAYENLKKNNDQVYTIMNKYFSYIGLASLANYNKFNVTITDTIFSNWYKSKLEKIMNCSIKSLNVYQQRYIWHNEKLQPIDTPIKMNYIVSR